jgi:hypothetical protein
MPKFVYFDTDAFHRIGQAFARQALAEELREKILLSPITFLEALSHLTLTNHDEVLLHIQAVRNWLNPKHAGLLAWPDVAIAKFGFNKILQDDFTDRAEKTITQCLSTDSADDFQESAGKLKDALDKMKDSTAKDFARLVELYRKEPLVGEEFSEVWAYGIARRVKADPQIRPLQEIVAGLSAYHEFEEERLKVAASNPAYKPDKNDLIDSEQLVYLGDPSLHFITCDGGYLKRIKKSAQAARIHKVSKFDLEVAGRVEALIAKITS